MPLMPGSPRPPPRDATNEDDGVYRSIFQQPLIEIPPSAPSYAWFEFLLHPEALQRHLSALRQQNARGAHGATSAIELIREFLDQAQLVADEGNVRNKRYKALLLVAAQVALQMHLPLVTIERALPLHFQRLLVDGIVDLCDALPTTRTAFTADITLAPYEARLLHHRWTLRAMVSQAQSGYLTATSRSDADELTTGFHLALSDLMASHLQIAKSIHATLLDDATQRVTKQTQLDAFVDLGVYYFSFNGYEKAYECFSRAAELAEDDKDAVTLAPDDLATLEGYLAACEAVLETRSLTTEGDTLAKSPKAQLEVAWESHEWDRVVALLQADAVAYALARLPPGYRAALEQRALRSVRLQQSAVARADSDVASLRRLYKRIALNNALVALVQLDGVENVENATTVDNERLILDTCVCTVVRLLHDELFYDAAAAPHHASLFPDLAQFVLEFAAFLHQHVAAQAQERLRLVLERLVTTFASIETLDVAAVLLAQCGVAPRSSAKRNQRGDADNTLLATETRVRAAIEHQRTHLRCTSDLSTLFAFERSSDRDALFAALRSDVAASSSLLVQATGAAGGWRNVLALCMLHNAWDVLAQWRAAAAAASTPVTQAAVAQLDFALACGALMQYLSSLESAHSSSSSSESTSSSKTEFSILASNKLVADVLLKRRHVLECVAETSTTTGSSESASSAGRDDAAVEIAQLWLDVPLWILETLVCIAAGLLHRASMRNICDYRISFELTPYGDLAFLQAFAPETSLPPSASSSRKRSAPGDTHSSSSRSTDDAEDAETALANANALTPPFIKSFQADLVALHRTGLACLAKRCAREPRWHCARADIALNPIVKQKLSSTSDPHAALTGYLVAASLATNFFADATSVVDIIDQSSLVRLSQCLVKVGAHVAAAVLYQCFAPEEFKYGLRILQLAPESHDEAFFQYFWEMPFLELLVHLHSSPKHYNSSHVTLLTHLIQSPELNSSNPAPVLKSVEQRILRCYFRDLCRLFLR